MVYYILESYPTRNKIFGDIIAQKNQKLHSYHAKTRVHFKNVVRMLQRVSYGSTQTKRATASFRHTEKLAITDMSNSSQAVKQTGSSVKEVYRLPRAGLFTSCTARWRASSKDCTYPPKISTISGTRRQTPRRTTTFLTQIYTRNAEVYI